MKGFACKLCGQRKEAQVWIRSLNAWKAPEIEMQRRHFSPRPGLRWWNMDPKGLRKGPEIVMPQRPAAHILVFLEWKWTL